MNGRVHRVLVEELTVGEMVLRGPEAHHLANVLRVKPGAAVEAFDGAGSIAAGSVKSVARDAVMLQLAQPAPSAAEAPLRVTVAVSLLKSDKLSDVVRQCTELGVAEFRLLVTQYADVTDLGPGRLQRLRRVAEEATRQSGRATVPAVHEPVTLDRLEWSALALVADPRAAQTLSQAMTAGAGDFWGGRHSATEQTAPESQSITLITGPEGGLSDAEVERLTDRGAQAIRFGPRIVRAETAPVALAAALLLPLGA